MAVNDNNSKCACAMSIAERELGAFINAVTNLHGPEQARISAEDWLDEFESMDHLPKSAHSEWRLITISAAARLARRLIDAGVIERA